MSKIRLLIIDDSALARQMLAAIFAATPDIEVVGSAPDAYVAREKIKQLGPDVLTLDVEMPRMDGVTFLGNLMRLRPMPVVMVSSLTEKGAEVTLRALEYGAVDFVTKPRLHTVAGLKDYADDIVAKVRAAARSRVRPLPQGSLPQQLMPVAATKLTADAVLAPPVQRRRFHSTEHIVAIGASTGGTEAIKEVLAALPAGIDAGIVISQHIPVTFSAAFAQRADSVSPLTVCQASDGQHILPGHVYIAPGDRHLLVEHDGKRYVCRLNDGPPVNRHKPSVDVMTRSLAHHAGANAIGVMLTGMGDDGAAGMGELKQAGARILVQDEASSVVWGMPGEVARRGYADEVLPLGRIASRLLELLD